MSKNQLPSMVKTWWAATAGLSALVTIVGFAVPTFRLTLEQIAWPWGWIAAGLLLPIAIGSIGQVLAQNKALREPDPVDVDQYATFRAALPTTQGTVSFLENFDGKRWHNSQVSPLEDVGREWEHWVFSNRKIRRAFVHFYRSQTAFIDWSTAHGFPNDSGIGSGWYTIDHKPGSEPSEKVRRDGLEKAKTLRNSIINFDRVGRLEGLR